MSTPDAFTQSIEGLQRAAQRDLDSFTRYREQRPPSDLDPNLTAQKLADWASQVRTRLNDARGQLTGADGIAAVAAAESWLTETEQKAAELRLLGEAFDLFRVEADVEGYGEIAFTTALDSVERNFDRDPERVVLAWDAVKKLAPAFQNPRFADVPEIQAALARHHELEQRVATELPPLIAKVRTAPLIRQATYSLESLVRDTDNLDEDSTLASRKQLREALLPLQRDWSEVPEVAEFLGECQRAFTHSEQQLGDKIVLREIQEVESFVKPLVERLERALALGSESRVLEHAPRLQARLATLAPFLAHQRAQLLDNRARAALSRIDPELARAVADAEQVPSFAIDIADDTKVQAVLTRLNQALETYREEHSKAQASFEESVDLINGSVGYGIDSTIDSASRSMIRFARAAEQILDDLRAIDHSHPAIAAVESAVPRLIERTQQWKERLFQKIEYANAIERARSPYEDAQRERQYMTQDDPYSAISTWPEILQKLVYVDEAVANAIEILPEEHDEADAWASKAAALRQEAIEKLTAVCVAEATRAAIDNDSYNAERYADALRSALPDAPENAQIAAIVAGTADARQQAEAEIAQRGELIRRRAEEAAQTLRPTFDEWAEHCNPLVALAGTIVQNIEQYAGKWIAGRASHLGRLLYDHHDELNGDIYQFDYDPQVRDALLAGMKRLDDLYTAMAENVVARREVSGVSTTTQHYPRDAHYLCEIVGLASYTPRREIHDNYGRLLGTVEGEPYPVPRVVIRGVATTYFVITPGHAPSLDAMNDEGLID